MSSDEITKLYRFMTEQFAIVNAKLDQKADKSDVNRIYSILDKHEGRLEFLEDEYVAIHAHLARIDKNIDGIAKHVGYTLA